MPDPRSSLRCARVAVAGSLIAAAIGGLTIVGWATGLETLASIRTRYIPMAPSTGLAFTLLGAAMLLQRGRTISRAIALICVGVVTLLAGAKLTEFFTGASLGIEELLVHDPVMFGAVRTGRMAPITALNFVFACVALLSLHRQTEHRWAGLAATAVGAVSLVVLLGYAYGTPLLYGGTIIPVALPTAFAFFSLSIALIAAAGTKEWPLRPLVGSSARALLLRWFLPATVGAALVGGYVRTKLVADVAVNPALLSALSTLVFALVITAIISQVAAIVGARIDRAETERNKAQAELERFNQDLERRIAERTRELSTKNAQMEEELSMARELQLAMLPRHFPCLPESALPRDSAIKFFSFYYPTGSVSGDFFDVFPLSDTAVGVFICDVMGHGVRAALVTSMMRALVEEYRGERSDPGQLLTHVNHGLVSILNETETTLFATAFMLVADVGQSELAYANAGHPAPVRVRRAADETNVLSGKGGPALGLFKDASYETTRCSIEVGDLIMLFTDGLFEVETPDGDLYTHHRLQEAVRSRTSLPPERMLEEILAEVQTFSGRSDFEDDVCLIGVEVAKVG